MEFARDRPNSQLLFSQTDAKVYELGVSFFIGLIKLGYKLQSFCNFICILSYSSSVFEDRFKNPKDPISTSILRNVF